MIQQSLSSELLGGRRWVYVLSFRTDINEEPEVVGVFREQSDAATYVERNAVLEQFHRNYLSQWTMMNGNIYALEPFEIQ